MTCCAAQQFERHPDPQIADIGQGGGVEYTVGACKTCGARLMHCWVGGVAESIQVVSPATVDAFIAASPTQRKSLLAGWFNHL